MIDAPLSQRIMGSMGYSLFIVGTWSAMKGISYFPPLKEPSRSPSHWLEHFFPLQFIGTVWIIVGVLCLLAIRYRKLRVYAWAGIVSLAACWMVSFGANWALYQGRQWVSSQNYYVILGLMFGILARHSPPEKTGGDLRE